MEMSEQGTAVITRHLSVLCNAPVRLFFNDGGAYEPIELGGAADPLVADRNFRRVLIADGGGVFLWLEEENILYGVCKNAEIVCAVGPVSLERLGYEALNHYKKQHNLLSCPDFNIGKGTLIKIATILALLENELNGRQIELPEIIEPFLRKYAAKSLVPNDFYAYEFQNAEDSRDHIPYQAEQGIMAAIRDGDFNRLKSHMEDYDALERVGVLAKKSGKQIEYMTITAITLYTRAAIDGGVAPSVAYNISDLYLQSVSECQDTMKLLAINKDAQKFFCECVAAAKVKNSGPHYIKLVKQFVAKHLYAAFSLDDIASAVGNNKCYLTHQFAQREGKSLKRYIQEERVKAAQEMLKNSDKPIFDIAASLCFETSSHFGSVFKKITGESPSQYRAGNWIG